MKVHVDTPIVSNDTVTLQWTQSEPNPFQRSNSFYFRYEGLNLTQFSPNLFYEIFLGLELRVFAAYDKPIEITFPQPVPRPTVEYWTAYYDLDQISISPIADDASYDPWVNRPTPTKEPRPYGVYFGGGKDSTLATCLLSELYGADQVVAIQFVMPRRPTARVLNHHERRQEALMLRPAREVIGAATQRIWTDYQATILKSAEAVRPHFEFYTVAGLPALLARGVSFCTFCIPWTAYPFWRLSDGSLRFRYARSRPEVLATQSTHYRRAFGADITVTNLNLLFSTMTSFRMLSQRYPRAFERIVMCTLGDVDERWCYNCMKCAEYSLYSLYYGNIDPTFDYERFFASSRYMHRLVEYAESGVELCQHNNAPWRPFLCSLTHYDLFCHMWTNITPAVLAPLLSIDAYANALIARAMFGNRSCPAMELLPARAIKLLGHDTARCAARIAAEHITVAGDLPGPFIVGTSTVEYDFSVPMSTRTSEVRHIRETINT